MNKFLKLLDTSLFEVTAKENGFLIFPYENGIITQEIGIEVSREEISNLYEIKKLNRNVEKLILSSRDENLASFSTFLECQKLISGFLNPKPLDYSFFKKTSSKGIMEIKKELEAYIPNSLFSLNGIKEFGICLIEELEIYKVIYYNGKEHLISDNNPNREIGLLVMFNYAWLLKWYLELVSAWKKDNENSLTEIQYEQCKISFFI